MTPSLMGLYLPSWGEHTLNPDLGHMQYIHLICEYVSRRFILARKCRKLSDLSKEERYVHSTPPLTWTCCTVTTCKVPRCFPAPVFRLKKICEIYSRVLGSEEALHVSVKVLTPVLLCCIPHWLVFTSRCTTRRRTGVRRSTPGAATQLISPQGSSLSMAGNLVHCH